MTAVTASIDIAVPPQRVWEVVMDPHQFDEWVTIHRRLGHVDDGELRNGFRSSRRSACTTRTSRCGGR